MKIHGAYTCLYLLLTLSLYSVADERRESVTPGPDTHFDQYGDLCWADEKIRLDNFAIALRQNPDWVGYIVVYAGRRSCAGEALYRAGRAKRWVMRRGIEPRRIIVKDGGYSEEVTTILQPLPRSKPEYSPVPGLQQSEVEVLKNCKGRIYKPRKCPKT